MDRIQCKKDYFKCVCVCVCMCVHARLLDVCVSNLWFLCPGSKTIANQHVSQGQRINAQHSEFPLLHSLDCIFIKGLIERDVQSFRSAPRWEPFALVVFSGTWLIHAALRSAAADLDLTGDQEHTLEGSHAWPFPT